MKKILALLLVFCMLFSVAALIAGCEDSGRKKKNASRYDDDDDDDDDDEDNGDDGDETGGEGDEPTEEGGEATDPPGESPSEGNTEPVPTEPTPTEPTPTEPTSTEPTPTEGDATESPPYGHNYSGTEEEVKNAAGVPISTVGDLSLTNGELQIHYWQNIYQLISSSYLHYYVNFQKPLNEQIFDAKTGMSWQDYLLQYALEYWHQMSAVRQYAEEHGFTLDAAGIQFVENLDDTFRQEVADLGYASVEAMLFDLYGPDVTPEHFKNYRYTMFYASEYIKYAQKTNMPTEEEIEAYFTENEAALASQGITKDGSFLHDVRHILILPENDTDEAKAACYTKALALLNQWRDGEATEESFAELARLYTEDPGSKETGGLYEYIFKNQMVEAFDAWIFNESHEYGDTGLVETNYGYHIMFYVKSTPSWIAYTCNIILNDRTGTLIENIKAQYPITNDYYAIKLGNPDVLKNN